ncbi:glycosyltransferase [Deinococcus yavapaiensis]|uniref:Glycosyltransferase involved in cell wall biosynthesis n=1 Tax=Deinococcus yavapaiensis KR-236 TaxID=694435 RepID=A0A318SRP7_9DEIO|nr:glycosyltransferase [Deinococcus yavapaiensis]PYE55757.1 glycosyltransferase involved in cell wall biosynthesis [Deinococcus yavapaiensis KR-236]
MNETATMTRTPQSPKRILLFLHDLAGGGAEKMMIVLANTFARRGHDVTIVLAEDKGVYFNLVDANVRVETLGTKRTATALLPLVRFLRRHRPDYLLSTLVHVNVYAIAARWLARSPAVLVVREANNLSENYAVEPKLIKVAYEIAKVTYKFADGVIAISKGVADILVETCDLQPGDIKVVYNPARITPDATPPVEPEHPWLVDDTRPLVVSMGRLEAQKDHFTLISAFARIAPATNARLLIVGSGSQRERLQAHIDASNLGDRVQIVPFTKRPQAYLRAARVFAFPSRWEGFGNVLVEALSCGCRVVSTDCCSGPNEILQGGVFGRLAPVGDADAFGAQLLGALNDPPRTPQEEAALQAHLRQFEPDVVADAYLAYFAALEQRQASALFDTRSASRPIRDP